MSIDFSAVDKIRAANPIVHCLTNYVTAADTANMLLAAGASPIMADAPEESAEITGSAQALSINIGTPSAERLSAMLKSCEAAAKSNIGAVLDPVGVCASEFRKSAAERILSAAKISVVRGNTAELCYLGGIAARSHGVDSGDSTALAYDAVCAAAEKYGCVCAATGAVDVISDGTRTAYIHNGVSMLKIVTGAGCMTSALIAAYTAVTDNFSAAVLGIAAMGICGEIAYERCADGFAGAGSFRAGLFDAMYGITAEIISERIKLDES